MIPLKLAPHWCSTNSRASLCIFPLWPCHSRCWVNDSYGKLSPPTSKGQSSSEVLAPAVVQMTFSLPSHPRWDLCVALTSNPQSFFFEIFRTECTFLSGQGCQFQESSGLPLAGSFGNTANRCFWLWLEIGMEILIPLPCHLHECSLLKIKRRNWLRVIVSLPGYKLPPQPSEKSAGINCMP